MSKNKPTLNELLNLLRQKDARMVRTNGNGDDHNRSEHWIWPACVRVPPQLAEQIKSHEQVTGGKDGIWPGHDQTWKMRGV
jgi:hypothetical protein